MISLKAFDKITSSLNQYNESIRQLENNLNVSFDDNWMIHIMDNVIKGLACAFHKDTDFDGFCYNELTRPQVDKLNEFIQYFVYAWECGDNPPAFIVYERTPALGATIKKECKCVEDAYEIIVDFVEHFQDDILWRLEDL